MKNNIWLTFAVATVLAAGCSSPVRTLEYKGGKLTMTEERSGGGTPRKWELKEVSSVVERDALRHAEWKYEGALHHEGSSDTFLMKREIDGPAAVPTEAARLPFSPLLITTLGTNTTADGVWQIGVSETVLDLTRRGVARGPEDGLPVLGWSSSISRPVWQAQTGWFIFIESESRVWAYDGDRRLYLDTETSNGNNSCRWGTYIGVFHATNFDCNFPCAVPSEAISHLPEQKQKQIQIRG